MQFRIAGLPASFLASLFFFIGVLPTVAQERPPEFEQMYQRGLAFYQAGKIPDAIAVAQQFVELAVVRYGEQHPLYATGLFYLAALYNAQDRAAEAERFFKRALAIKEKALGPDHPELVDIAVNLADLYQRKGRFAEAEPLLTRVLTIQEKAFGADNAEVAHALRALAGLYRNQGRASEADLLSQRSRSISAVTEKRKAAEFPEQAQEDPATLNAEVERLYREGKYAEAIKTAEKSLAINEKVHGPEHPEVATSLNNLAEIYRAQGRYLDAEPLLKRAVTILEKALGPGHPSVATSLNNLGLVYQAQARHAEAEPLHKRSLAIREAGLPPGHPDIGQSLNNLAQMYWTQGRLAEAEPLFTRTISIFERALGAEHPNVGTAVNNLGMLYFTQGRFAEAEPLLRRNLLLSEKVLGPNHPDLATSLTNLAFLYQAQGRYPEAEPLFKRAASILEAALGPGHPSVAAPLNGLAETYRTQGRYAEAEALWKRAASIVEMALGRDHPGLTTSLNSLADMYRIQGRYSEAESLLKRAVSLTEMSMGPDHPGVSVSLNSLAALYQVQGRFSDAEPLHKRSLAIRESAFGSDHPDVATSLNNLAELYRAQGRFAAAEPLYHRSLAIREKLLSPEHPDIGQSLNNLALLYQMNGRHSEAEELHKRALKVLEKTLGPEHPDIGTSINNLAELYGAQARYAEAETLHKRALAIREKALGSEHPDVGATLNNMAILAYTQRNWASAADDWRRSTSIFQSRARRDLSSGRGGANGSEVHRLAWLFSGLVKATSRQVLEARSATKTVVSEMFETAQWGQGSEAAASLAQMAARSAKGSHQLAGLVRERQDLVSEWQAKDKLLVATKSEAPAKRKADAEKVVADRLAAIDIRLASIDAQLAREFPDYADLAIPVAVSVAEVQAQLGGNEALVLFLDTPEVKPLPEETFIWVVTRGDARWVRSDVGTVALGHEVAALRCGLDRTAWYGTGAENCIALLGVSPNKVPGPTDPLPFDHARAHKLYAALFGEVQDLIKGKGLLIVPSGPLTQLPFQVLVTKPPVSSDHRAATSLAREHAITILPAVSSLKALRRVGKPSAAPRQMIGFGNPLLDGPDARYAARAVLAAEKQNCENGFPQQIAEGALRRDVQQVVTRDGLADVSHIKTQVPLPETAIELCAVARDMKVDVNNIHLGMRATEGEIKRLSESGELAKYRMVHFATHGVLGGQLDGQQEPGLILTPPDKATAVDDGYLSASEIAALKLDADWVILSACNTAAGAATSAEALSGLARAFIYAQARALLVSHWEVYSEATVKLITTAMREMVRDPRVGRAEATRRSMLALIDKGEPHEAHPAYWAPFVVVGEGGQVSASTAASPATPRIKAANPSKSIPVQDWRLDVLQK